ncbi:helix-turn-helix domain-containing protein [Hydrogenophaga sp.]|uniref:winged helix-turn-helix transcriptional regulator n=1 Tax=Hydrogenophaga sp. TaxID=1904254 RepID=UPI00271CCDE3|nr:winged helix-turn-helix transcriptional regulator [Hydrogenophaga sp.]MDO9434621.1 winged helix-turn-helix transcriptional regulator [Hydrogenophaga sp.]
MLPAGICSSAFARAFAELAADRWGFLLILGAFRGNRRFQDWERSAGFTPSVLANRLRHMLDVGVLRQRPIDATSERMEYLLTDKGLGLHAWSLAVWRWERDWHNPASAPHDDCVPVLVHRNCGADTTPQFVCDCCAVPLEPEAVSWRPGPGLDGKNYLAGLTSRRADSTSDEARPKYAGGAFDLISDRWTLALIVALFQGIRRYEALRTEVGVSTNILALRLKRMVEDGLIARERPGEHTERFEYTLTDKGRALYPVVLGLTQWADRWLSGYGGIRYRMHHASCGADCRTEVRCDACAQPLTPHDVAVRFAGEAQAEIWSEQALRKSA